MKSLKSLSFALALIPALSLPLQAGKLQKEFLPTETKWVAHLDLDAFRSSQIGSKVFKRFLEKPLTDVQSFISMDLEKEFYSKLGGVTIYGTDFTTSLQNNAGAAVILVKAQPEAQTALDKVLDILKMANPSAVEKET